MTIYKVDMLLINWRDQTGEVFNEVFTDKDEAYTAYADRKLRVLEGFDKDTIFDEYELRDDFDGNEYCYIEIEKEFIFNIGFEVIELDDEEKENMKEEIKHLKEMVSNIPHYKLY